MQSHFVTTTGDFDLCPPPCICPHHSQPLSTACQQTTITWGWMSCRLWAYDEERVMGNLHLSWTCQCVFFWGVFFNNWHCQLFSSLACDNYFPHFIICMLFFSFFTFYHVSLALSPRCSASLSPSILSANDPSHPSLQSVDICWGHCFFFLCGIIICWCIFFFFKKKSFLIFLSTLLVPSPCTPSICPLLYAPFCALHPSSSATH